MLEIAYEKGGALLKFGGDALLLAFAGNDHARMAAEAAVAMRGAAGGQDASHVRRACQPAYVRRDPQRDFSPLPRGDSHRELLISGPAATTTTQMSRRLMRARS